MLLLVLTAVFWASAASHQMGPVAPDGDLGDAQRHRRPDHPGCLRGAAVHLVAPQIAVRSPTPATVTLFVVATKLTTAANAILLQYTAPIHVALFGPGFSASRRAAGPGRAGGHPPAAWSCFSRTTLSGRIVGERRGARQRGLLRVAHPLLALQKGGSGIESILLGNLLAAAIGLPFMFGEMPTRGAGRGSFSSDRPDGDPVRLFSMAVRNVPAVTAILVPMIEPVLNPLWVLLLLGEAPSPMAVAGGIVILGTVAARSVAGFSPFHRPGV
jgi:hypothetical protein